MKQRKRIRVFCHGPVSASPRHESPWEDLHYSWKVRPGRPRVMSGFCLESLPAADNQVWFDEQLVAEHGDMFADDLASNRAHAEAIRRDGIAVNDWSWDFPTVGVSDDRITRATAERAMTWALEAHHGLRGPFKFDWNKTRGAFVIPVDLGPNS